MQNKKRLLKEKYPGVPVVSYVNTSADVKAETDVCCTSANAVKIVKSFSDLENLPNVECIVEELVEFKNELAVIVARNVQGEIKTYRIACCRYCNRAKHSLNACISIF